MAFPASAHAAEDSLGIIKMLSTTPAPADGIVSVSYATNYIRNSYNAYATLFNVTGLTKGVHYDANWTINPTSFPNNTNLTWYVPEGKVLSGSVWGYHHLDFNTKAAAQFKNIKNMTTTFDWSFTGSPFFNLLVEFWLAKSADAPAWTTDPNVPNSAYYEIGLFLHCEDYKFHNGGTLIGTTHSNNGVVYTCRANGRYITFAPQSENDVLIGMFDWILARNFLISNRVITGSEWVVDYAPLFGIEPTYKRGSRVHGGAVRYNSLSTTYSII